MSIQEMKTQLHQLINNIDNEGQLEFILYFTEVYEADKDFWNGLTHDEQEITLQYLRQLYVSSKVLPKTEIALMLDSWKRELKEQP